MKLGRIYSGGVQYFLERTFLFWQRLGFHITPVHYYQPLPDTRELKDGLWQKPSELIGVEMNAAGQLTLLAELSAKYKKEYESFPRTKTENPLEYYVNNRTFTAVDGEILYCLIRSLKPRRILEIGSGNSTFLSAQAILKNKAEDCDYQGELVVIDPFPRNEIFKKGFPGLTQLITKKVQAVPLAEFKKLTANDILFIDSSHVLKIGSDVQFLFSEILPRLNPGVVIHFHDIFLPLEYPRKWILQDCLFWTEQYLLQAFLTFNDTFKVLWGSSYMHLKYPDKLAAAFSSYQQTAVPPGSFWLKKIK